MNMTIGAIYLAFAKCLGISGICNIITVKIKSCTDLLDAKGVDNWIYKDAATMKKLAIIEEVDCHAVYNACCGCQVEFQKTEVEEFIQLLQ